MRAIDAPAVHTPAPAPEAWPPLALPGSVATPEILPDVLPDWVGQMAGAVAGWSQTPPAMAVIAALVTLSAGLQRRFEVSPFGDDYREPLSLWAIGASPSGSRKSAVINAMTEPLVRWEKAERDRLRPEIARNAAVRGVGEKRIEKLKADAARAEDAQKRALIEDEIQRELEAMPEELRAPCVFTGDVTAETLQRLLCENDERMSVITDEGGIFGIMAGQYTGGSANYDIFLQAHSGSPVRVHRAARTVHLDRPGLGFCMFLQPEILADAGKNSRFRASGLMARFLYVIPKSNVGERDVRARNPISPEVRGAWVRHMQALLDNVPRPIGAPRVLTLEDAARERWLQFCEVVELQQGPGRQWEHIADWTGKLPGAVARIAGLIELASAGLMTQAVTDDSMERAVRLGWLLTRHAEAAFRLMGAADGEGDALALMRWIEANQLHSFTRRQAQKGLEGRFRTKDRLLEAVRVLQDWAVLGPSQERLNPGARSTTVYPVNPALFVAKSS